MVVLIDFCVLCYEVFNSLFDLITSYRSFRVFHFSWLSFGSFCIFRDFSVSSATAKSLQSCGTLCDPIDSSPPGFPVPGILQARTLEWVAISFSSAWKWEVKVKSLSCVWLLATPWTAAHQAPPSMGFFGQECWSGVPLPSLSSLLLLPKGNITLSNSDPPKESSHNCLKNMLIPPLLCVIN